MTWEQANRQANREFAQYATQLEADKDAEISRLRAALYRIAAINDQRTAGFSPEISEEVQAALKR